MIPLLLRTNRAFDILLLGLVFLGHDMLAITYVAVNLPFVLVQ